ncbi:MAG: penicillin-binding protein 2 [Actinobacteria bacterium]|nr:penicillin-binding protein 2 [Actinomycetota bacterium]
MGLIERRIGLLSAIFLCLFVLAIGRAGKLMVLDHASLKERATGQQVGDQVVAAPRGAILDRNGEQFAVSTDAADVSATPYLIDSPPAVAQKLAPLIGKDADEIAAKLSDRESGFAYLARGVDGRSAQKIRKLELAGIDVMPTTQRFYPSKTVAAQMLGFVGTEGKGLSGLEYAWEKQLHGTDGRRRIVKDGAGDPIQTITTQQVQPGSDLRLTIDSQMQLQAESVLARVGTKFQPKGSTAIVMNPQNGEVLALANWPKLDANDPTSATPEAQQNRALGFTYEPGSTFKAVTVAGALQEKKVTPETIFGLPPTLQVADRVIKESHDRGAISLSVSQILAQSSNVGSVKIGLELGAEKFDSWVRRFGFGKPTGIDLAGEEQGLVLRHQEYSGSSMGNLPIGQGIAVTPIQMAAAYSAIANGGVLRPPRVVKQVGDEPAEQPRGERIISGKTAASLRKMLEGVVGAGGTAAEAAIPGYDLAGKTGTAQKIDPQTGEYSKSNYVASFIGFAPASKPKLLVAVMVDEPRNGYYGGEVAAPAFQEILNFALPYMRIPPN